MKARQFILNNLLVMFLVGSIPCVNVHATDIPDEAISEAADMASDDSSGIEASTTDISDDNIPEEELSPAERLERVKSSVVQINCVYVDDDGKHHIIKGAPGTLIGKSDGDEYVITGMNSITPKKDLKRTALKALGVEDDDIDNANLKYEVVVQNDIVFSADILSSSEELNLEVFKLAQALSHRTPMTLLYSENGSSFSGIEDVHAYGFPDAIVYGKNEIYYPNERVNRISGKVSNVVHEGNVEWIEHNATIAESNSGGPLVTSEGEMIGLNILKTEGAYFYSISSNSIVKALDGLGIEYDKISVEEKEKQKEAEQLAASESSTAENTITVVTEPSIPSWLIIVMIVLIVLVLATMMAVITMMVKKSDKPSFKERREKKKEEKEKQITPEQFDNRRSSKVEEYPPVNNMEGTSVLNAANAGDTSILTPGSNTSVVQGIYGSMFRKQYSENIIINKMRFVIGKDAAHVDYCIKNNGAISRQHAVITVNGNGVYIEDLGSTNGTMVNGNKLSNAVPVLLNDGDVIRFADEEFEFRK